MKLKKSSSIPWHAARCLLISTAVSIGIVNITNKAGYTAQDAPSMRAFHPRK